MFVFLGQPNSIWFFIFTWFVDLNWMAGNWVCEKVNDGQWFRRPCVRAWCFSMNFSTETENKNFARVRLPTAIQYY